MMLWLVVVAVWRNANNVANETLAQTFKKSRLIKKRKYSDCRSRENSREICPCYTVVVVMTVAKHQATVAPSEVSPHSQPRVTVKVQYTHLHPHYTSCILLSLSLSVDGWRVPAKTYSVTSRIDQCRGEHA